MQIQGYEFHEELYYNPDHCWVREEGEFLVMGIDDFGQKLAGEIVFVQLPADGKKLKKGKAAGKIESGKWLGKVISPVDGILEEVNEELEISPNLVNEDPYGEGWIYKIKPNDKTPLSELIKGKQALEAWMADEMKKYADQM
jgi:glycine cleavage system H protein